MFLFNPCQPKAIRSPSFGKDWGNNTPTPMSLPDGMPTVFNVPQFPVDSTGKLQFGNSINSIVDAIPGPLIQDQPVANDSRNPRAGDDRVLEYPGRRFPVTAESDGLTFQCKHFSNSVFYNQEPFSEGAGFGASPYWRFAEWAANWPEYFILKGSASIEVTTTLIIDGEPVDFSFTLGTGNYNLLLRRCDGYKFTGTDNSTVYQDLFNPNMSNCATWVPVYDLANNRFPNRFLSEIYLRFGSFKNYTQDIFTDAALAPFSWHLGALTLNDIKTVNILTFFPRPTTNSGSFDLSYVSSTLQGYSGQVTYSTNTATLIGNIGLLFPTIPATLLTPQYDVTITTLVDTDEALVLQLEFHYPFYAVLDVSANTTDGLISAEESSTLGDVSAVSGTFIRLIPKAAWDHGVLRSAINGTCKDTRYPDNMPFNQDKPEVGNGKTWTQYGISYGSISQNRTTPFRPLDVFINSLLDSTSLENPGRPFYYAPEFDPSWSIDGSIGEITIEPVYL